MKIFRKKYFGMTLAEMMVSCSLLIVFLGACYTLFTKAIVMSRMSDRGDDRTLKLAEVRDIIYILSRDIRECEALVLPDSSVISNSAAPYSSDSISIFLPDINIDDSPLPPFDATKLKIVTYRYDPGTHNIEKLVYNPNTASSLDFVSFPLNWTQVSQDPSNAGVILTRFGKRKGQSAFAWEAPDNPNVVYPKFDLDTVKLFTWDHPNANPQPSFVKIYIKTREAVDASDPDSMRSTTSFYTGITLWTYVYMRKF